MGDCRVTPKNKRCNETIETGSQQGNNQCSGTSICLAFGKVLSYDGSCWSVSGAPAVVDGWYDRVHVVNGCIVDADVSPLPIYVPPPCTPTGSGGGGTSTCGPLSPDPTNLLTCVGDELLGRLYFGTSTGVTVTGYGTATHPLEFTVSLPAQQTYINSSTPDILEITGSGVLADAYLLSIKTSPLPAGTYNGITFNSYGIAIAHTEVDNITALSNGIGTQATVVGTVGKVDLAPTGVTASNYNLGAYSVAVNQYGQVTSTTRQITLAANTYAFGIYDVTINEFGSITNVVAAPPADLLTTKFVRYFPAPAVNTVTDYSVTVELQVDSALLITFTSGEDTLTACQGMHANIAVNGAQAAIQHVFVAGQGTCTNVAISKGITGVITAGACEIIISNKDGQYLNAVGGMLEIELVSVIP